VGSYGRSQAPANFNPVAGVLEGDARTTSFVPLPMLTAAHRLCRRTVAGVFVYAPSGAGASYDGVNFGVPGLPPRPFGMTMYDFEAGPMLAVRLPGRIDLGVAYRMTWIRGTMKGYDPSSLVAGDPKYTESELSGTDFSGFKLGVQANPVGRLKLGLAYRTPITVDLSGKTKVMAPADSIALAEVDVTAQVRNVDKLLFGVSYEWIEGKLFTALDYERQFYGRSRDIVVTSPGGETTVPQRYHDSNIVRLGGEYRVLPGLPIRAGVGFFDDFRDRAYLGATAGGAPAPTYLFSAGAGWAITPALDIDLSYTLMQNSGTLAAAAATPTNTPGRYENTTHALSLELGIHM
jgi:long-subunit fatty acid transport protein